MSIGIPGEGWVRDQFLNAIATGLNAIQDQVFAIIGEILGIMEALILQVPVPKNESGQTVIFSVPDSGIFSTLYGIYQGAQPIGYFLLFLAVIIIVGFETFEDVIPDTFDVNPRTGESKKIIATGFILVTFWWYIGVIIFGIANLITNLFLEAGSGGGEGEGLTIGFDLVRTFVEDAEGPSGPEKQVVQLGSSAILIYLYGTNLTILLPLLALWVLRLILLYLILPLGPVLIGLWGFRIPGFEPLQQIGTRGLKWFSLLTFVSVPGAVLIGFSGVILDSVLSLISSDSGITGESGFGENADSIVINSGPDTSASLELSRSEVLASELTGGGPVAQVGGGGFYAGVMIGTSIAVAIPFIAAAGPFILVALGNMDASDVATMAVNPAGGAAQVMAKGMDTKGKSGEYAGAVMNKANSALTGNDEFVGKDEGEDRASFNTSTGSLDKDAAVDRFGADSYDELSRRQKAKARSQQTGVLGTGSWATDEAATKAKENYQEAYVEGRALATNSDYRSGVVSEATSDIANTVSTKASNIRPEPVKRANETREEMSRRLNNAVSTHEQLKDEAAMRDYKDGADTVDGELLMTDDEDDLMELFEEHGYNPELESESITETEVEGMKQDEFKKYQQLQERIEEKKESRTEKVSKKELDTLQDLRENVQMLDEIDPSGDSPFDESSDNSARPNALAVAEKAEEVRKTEEHGMLNYDKAIDNGLLSMTRQAQRGELTPDEMRDLLEELEEKKGYADQLVENSEDKILQRDAEKRQKELQREMEAVQQSVNQLDQLERTKEDAERIPSRLDEKEKELEDAMDSFTDRFDEIANDAGNSIPREAEADEFVKNNGEVDSTRMQEEHGVSSEETNELSNIKSEVRDVRREKEDIAAKLDDLKQNISAELDSETREALLEQNEEYQEIQNELSDTMSDLEDSIRERKDIDKDQNIIIDEHRDALSESEIETLESVREDKESIDESEIVAEEMTDEHVEEIVGQLEAKIDDVSFVEHEEALQGDEFDAIIQQVESAEQRLEENKNSIEAAVESYSNRRTNEAMTVATETSESMARADIDSEELAEQKEHIEGIKRSIKESEEHDEEVLGGVFEAEDVPTDEMPVDT